MATARRGKAAHRRQISSGHNGDSVGAVVDALHGHIDLSDAVGNLNNQIRRIVSAPFVTRLRRIKQLGFVSQNFLSAQHNRYSHALGTIEIMRKLVANSRVEDVLARSLQAISRLTGDHRFKKGSSTAVELLKQHLLVVAAIQDVGELPYEKATARTFIPGSDVRNWVKNAAVDFSQMRHKDQFTLYFIYADGYEQYFAGLDKTLLTYLICGLVPDGKKEEPELRAIRQLADGHLDADRLDYVYRDAFHTIGIHHSVDALIDSIEDYDADGPILSHVRPITDFIVTRAMLWSNVYLSPENRFRLILLRLALTELSGKPDAFAKFFKFKPDQAITPDQFLSMDDMFIDNKIREVAVARDVDITFDAFRLLSEGAMDYEYRWVNFAKKEAKNWPDQFELPQGFYWDTYADYHERNHTLYTAGSVRITGRRYNLLSPTIKLEDCVGPFCSVLKDKSWPALPMPEHMAWFFREKDLDSTDGAWRALFEFKHAEQLTARLKSADPLKGVATVLDTVDKRGFKGPAIFLTFAWEEKEYLDRVARVLFDEKRQYWALTDGSEGIGLPSPTNSIAAIEKAGAVIVLASRRYAEKFSPEEREEKSISEISLMKQRRDNIPIVFLLLDPYKELISNTDFPWRSLGRDGNEPFLGISLRESSSEEFRNRVGAALAEIDGFRKRR